MSIQRESQHETEKAKKELEEMRNSFTCKLTQDYIKIDKHEQLINEELSKANEKLQDSVKKLRDRFEQELTHKLEE